MTFLRNACQDRMEFPNGGNFQSDVHSTEPLLNYPRQPYPKPILLIRSIIVVSLLLLDLAVFAQQQVGYVLTQGTRRLEIPFELFNNLVVIPVTLENQITLNFILDTGVQNTILTNRVYADILGLDYSREVVIRGPGENDSIKVHVVDVVDLEIDRIQGKNTPLIVLGDDFLKLSNNLGANVHGIIGYDLFRQFVVEIDVDARKVIFHDPKRFRKKKHYKKRKIYRRVPLSVERRKPYVNARVEQLDGEKVNVKLMVDTGASHAVLLNPATSNKINIPEENMRSLLGRGLGGEIHGVVGRVNGFKMDRYEFESVIAFYPDEEHYGYGLRSGDRNGTIGGELLTRFNYVINYPDGWLYLRKNSEYDKDFEFDLCGLDLMSFGGEYEIVMVKDVRVDSPAWRAGVRKGDVIEAINGRGTQYVTLNYINALIRSKVGKKIQLRIKRGQEELRFRFELERLI